VKPRTAFLACGILASALYLAAIDLLAPIAHPEYHSYRFQMVSELFAVEAPTRPLLAVPMTLYNALMFAFVVGVWMSGERRRTVRLAAAALGVYATVSTFGFFVAAMDVRGPQGMTDRDVIHVVATVVQGMALLSAVALGAFARGRKFRVYSLVTLAICLGFGAVAGLAATWEGSPWLGTAERISIYAWMSWVAVFAGALMGGVVRGAE
jgi:hypothetical protein